MAEADVPKMDIDAWKDRAQSEVGFWQHWVQSKGDQWPDDFNARANPETPLLAELQHFLDELGTDRAAPTEILDIGSGPLSILGYKSPGREIRLTLVDPLASSYNQILDQGGIAGVPRPQTGYFESALGQFGENRFDVVWCRNALDHSIDPLLGLHNLISMCKIGGGLMLSFHPNEADGGDYEGLHQWNLDKRGDRIILAQKGQEVDLTPLLRAQKLLSITQEGTSTNFKGMIRIRLQKLRASNLSQAMMRPPAS